MNETTVTDYAPQTLLAKRMELGMSRGQLEQAVGAKYGDAARWEAGTKGIPVEIFKRLAFMFHCDAADLMTGGKT